MEVSTSDLFPQIMYGLIVVGIVYAVYMSMEVMWRIFLGYSLTRVAVYPMTGSSAKVFTQDPSDAKSVYLPVSQNQLTGIEFSYSTFLYIADTTFKSTDSTQLSTVFYKGYTAGPFPLCGPGVFVTSDGSNNPILRIIMNSYSSWYNAVDIKQIPVNKWFHLVLVLSSNNTLNVYINGNLANKMILDGTIAYQNYQPLHVLPPYTTPGAATAEFDNSAGTSAKRGVPAGKNFVIKGPMEGYVSNIFYYSYAIGYAEIQSLLQMGPSSQMDTTSMITPPYLIDTWWTQQKNT